MNEDYAPYLFIIHTILFIGMWFLVSIIIRKKSGMTKEDINEATGPILADSGWGSANINGVLASNCIKVVEYEHGYLLKMMLIFGKGKLWMPKGGYSIIKHQPKRLCILPESKEITWLNNRVKLYGKLAANII